jgi:DeoR family transcriptional regulator of aga operon
LLEPQDSIIIASGTSVTEFARQIDQNMKLTVLTASLNVSGTLSNSQQIEVIQLGGAVRRNSASVIGPFAENMLSEFTCNKLFLGVDGIDLAFGLTTTSSMEASLNKTMIKVAQKVIILADSSKFGRRGFGRICGLEKIDIIVTDNGIDSRFQSQIEKNGIKVIVT